MIILVSIFQNIANLLYWSDCDDEDGTKQLRLFLEYMPVSLRDEINRNQQGLPMLTVKQYSRQVTFFSTSTFFNRSAFSSSKRCSTSSPSTCAIATSSPR